MSRQALFALAVTALALGTSLTGRLGVLPGPAEPQAQIAPQARDPSLNRTQQIPIGTGAIIGTVTAADTGRALQRARVTLTGATSVVPPGRAGVPAATPGAVVGRGLAAGLTGPGGLGLARGAVTDALGQFSFDRLPAGQFTLTVTRDQFLTTIYGQRQPGRPGIAIQLGDGQHFDLKVAMIRGGVISGIVRGDDGEPITNAQVRALRSTLTNGIKRLAASAFASTDDRGMYRLFGLMPGDYVVAATPNPSDLSIAERAVADAAAFEQAVTAALQARGSSPTPLSTIAVPIQAPAVVDGSIGPPAGYAPTYFPSSATTSVASSISLGPGEERGGVDIQALTIRAGNVVGTVVGIPAPTVAVQITILTDDPSTDGMTLPSARAGGDGKFTLRNIPPGQYMLFAQTVAAPTQITAVNGVPTGAPQIPVLDDSQRMWGRVPVSIDGQSTPTVTIPLQPGRSISGSVAFEMVTPPDLTRTRMNVTLQPAPSAQATPVYGLGSQSQVGADGRFVLSGVLPGRFSLRVSGGGFLKSSVVNGDDTLDFPFTFNAEQDVNGAVLTVTDRTTELSGTLTESSGKPALDYTIVIAASDTRFWTPGSRRILTVRPGTDGRYTFRNLPPGDYMLAAVTDIEQGAQFDPEFLRALTGASARVTIGEGAKLQQNLRVAQ